MRPTVTPPTVTVLDRGSRSRNALVASPPDPDPVSPSPLDDSSGYGTDASDASAADAAAADASSIPGGHANTFVLTTAQSSSASLCPRTSMEWSNSWLPRHACVTGMAFMADTAAAPRSSDDSSDGERKSPLRVHRNSSPGSTLSWMKQRRADRLCSSYTASDGTGTGIGTVRSARGCGRVDRRMGAGGRVGGETTSGRRDDLLAI